jgi:hypothetical protein
MEVLHPRCALDVHKDRVVACARHLVDGAVKREVRTFATTTRDLLSLSAWLAVQGCTHIVMEATGVYWKPVWHILSEGDFALTLASCEERPGPQDRRQRCDLAGRPPGPRLGPRQLRAGHPDAGAA